MEYRGCPKTKGVRKHYYGMLPASWDSVQTMCYYVTQEKAHKAMDYLWNQRHRSSDLVGTVINIHNGDWIRRGAGSEAKTVTSVYLSL